MKIVNLDEQKKMQFSQLEIGDTFIFIDSNRTENLCMKILQRKIQNAIGNQGSNINAIQFCSVGQPSFTFFGDAAYVRKVESTLSYKEI